MRAAVLLASDLIEKHPVGDPVVVGLLIEARLQTIGERWLELPDKEAVRQLLESCPILSFFS